MKVIACFASTLDGKIGSASSPQDRVGSCADLTHLLAIRNQANAILCGGETFRQHANIRKGSTSAQAPLQCIMTRRFDLPPDASLFHNSTQSEPHVPILIISPEPAPEAVRRLYPAHVEWLSTGSESAVQTVLEALRQRNIQTLMVEGGGHIMNLFLKDKAIHELYLTLCPLLLGGTDNPSLLTGQGFTVGTAPRTQVIHSEWTEQELYLHLKLHYPDGN